VPKLAIRHRHLSGRPESHGAASGDLSVDLYAPIPRGATILREALLVADHNAYHLGYLALVRRVTGRVERER
jgi:hypothetical protein